MLLNRYRLQFLVPPSPEEHLDALHDWGVGWEHLLARALHRVSPAHLLLDVHHQLHPPKIAVFDFRVYSTQLMQSQLNSELPHPRSFALLARQYLVQIPETSSCCCSTRKKSC